MSHQTDLRLLTLAGVAHRCSQETENFFQRRGYDPRYCFELFRRAIINRSQHAWEFLYNQYRPLVAGWVERHAAFPNSGEEVQFFINRAFEKMWGAVSPEKFARFDDLKSLLRYLQMCVHSVIVDQVRVAERSEMNSAAEAASYKGMAEEPGVETQALAQVRREEIWRAIGARLRDEREQRVVYGSFILGLKPREIYAQFGETFRDVQEIYRVKENVLARLRRDDELEKFIQDA